jgi:hypothetical protein
MLLPVLNIDICDTTNQQLKLSFIKDIDMLWWDELVEASSKGVELLLNSLLDTPLCNKTVANKLVHN